MTAFARGYIITIRSPYHNVLFLEALPTNVIGREFELLGACLFLQGCNRRQEKPTWRWTILDSGIPMVCVVHT